jgi:hypothetical protein
MTRGKTYSDTTVPRRPGLPGLAGLFHLLNRRCSDSDQRGIFDMTPRQDLQ